MEATEERRIQTTYDRVGGLLLGAEDSNTHLQGTHIQLVEACDHVSVDSDRLTFDVGSSAVLTLGGAV